MELYIVYTVCLNFKFFVLPYLPRFCSFLMVTLCKYIRFLYFRLCLNTLYMLYKSIDLILCDLPYNTEKRTTTHNDWDVPIDLDKLWEQYKRIIKDNGAIVLFGNEVFSSELINSNKPMFKYKWYWNKTRGNNFINAKIMPMKCIEELNVFYKHTPTYNPQYWYSTPYETADRVRNKCHTGLRGGKAPTMCTGHICDDGRRYPLSLLTFKKEKKSLHQSQKPVALLEYIIKTYTNEGDIVLDNCMGSRKYGSSLPKSQ